MDAWRYIIQIPKINKSLKFSIQLALVVFNWVHDLRNRAPDVCACVFVGVFCTIFSSKMARSMIF